MKDLCVRCKKIKEPYYNNKSIPTKYIKFVCSNCKEVSLRTTFKPFNWQRGKIR